MTSKDTGKKQHFLSIFLNFVIVSNLCNNAPLGGTLAGAKETLLVASPSSAGSVPPEAFLVSQILHGTQKKSSNVIRLTSGAQPQLFPIIPRKNKDVESCSCDIILYQGTEGSRYKVECLCKFLEPSVTFWRHLAVYHIKVWNVTLCSRLHTKVLREGKFFLL